MQSEHDDWWSTLDEDRKASIHRWLTGGARPPGPLDCDEPLFTDDGSPVDMGAPV